MRIELDFTYDENKYHSFEDIVKYIKNWSRSAAKNRRFKDVKVMKVEENPDGWPTVTFEGEENALKKLFAYYVGLTKKDAINYEEDFKEHIVSEEKEKLDEVDYGKNNTRRKHFVASDKPTRYWIAAAEQNPENITHFVKMDWATRRPICVPTSVVSDEARSDMKPFMTTDPGKIHTVALMASKLFPKFYLNVQEENYRETAKSRWTNTARPHGMGIEWDPKTKHWFGNMEEVLGPATPIAKKDDLGYDKKTDSKPKSKYEQMDPRKLPYEKSRLEKEIERTEKTVEDIRKSGNKSGKLEKFEKDLAQLKTELEEVNKLLA